MMLLSPHEAELVGSALNAVVPIASALGAWYAWQAKRESKEAKRHASEVNDAVNHRHPGQPRLFDLAVQNHAKIEVIEEKVSQNHEFITSVQDDLVSHIRDANTHHKETHHDPDQEHPDQ